MNKVKTQIIFPEELLKQLDLAVKKRKRSDFVVDAVEDKLKGLNLQRALKSVAGLWKERNDLKTETDAKRYLKGLRKSDAVREKRLKKAWKGG